MEIFAAFGEYFVNTSNLSSFDHQRAYENSDVDALGYFDAAIL